MLEKSCVLQRSSRDQIKSQFYNSTWRKLCSRELVFDEKKGFKLCLNYFGKKNLFRELKEAGRPALGLAYPTKLPT